MRTSRLLITFFCMIVATRVATAEKVPLSPEELRKTATHVVVGKVQSIFTRTTDEGDWRVTRYVAEVKVEKTEEGDELKAGDLVYARYWSRHWISSKQQPPSTNGHLGLPTEGQSLRIYLAKNAYDGFSTVKDGGYTVIGANGFESLQASTQR